MRKNIVLTLSSLLISVISFAISPIVAYYPYAMGTCVGGTTSLHDSTAGGVWSSSNVSVATIDASGTVTGLMAGTATISYTVGSSYVTATFSVTPAPAAIMGTGTMCVDATLTLSDATPGGTWSATGGTASITAAGVVTGRMGGDQIVYYTVATGCSVTTTVTVAPSAFSIDSSVTGPSTVCLGSSITLSNAVAGGTWSSGAPAVATVAATGLVTGMSIGTAAISYTATLGACANSVKKIVTVTSTTNPGTISGSSAINVGSPPTTFTDVTGDAGGIWSSSSTGVATVGATTAVVTAVAPGTTTISYTVTSCGSTASATKLVTVSNIDGISGNILFGGSPFTGSVKVWLITYNPSTFDLEASDSLFATHAGSGYFYQFLSVPTDSFRVKAAASDSFVASGYLPTYHNSNFYWHDASVIYHTTGTADVNKNINMISGTVSGGPGFISGSVLTGANRGTSGSIPVAGMHMVALTSSGAVAQFTHTDATGNYSFTGLPYGTYTIFPDSLNYATTPLTGITLTSSSPSVSTASFIQHTLSKTITPGTEGVHNTPSAGSSVSVYPNPTSGKINLFWYEAATEKASITISDITGREIYTNTITLTEGSGVTPVDLSTFSNGLYMMTVKSASINYNNKIEIQH